MSRHQPRAQGGYAMIVVMGVTMIVALLGTVMVSSILGNVGFAADSRERKAAYAAAQSGVAYYAQQLARDNDGAAKCENVADPNGGPSPLNRPWDGRGADPRVWRAMPTTQDAPATAYTVELLGVDRKGCDPGNPASIVDPRDGTITIRATGRATAPGRTERRTIVATLRRGGFLDFVYFTNFESLGPLFTQILKPGVVTQPSLASWWAGDMAKRKANPTLDERGCAQYRDPAQGLPRDDARFPGLVQDASGNMVPARQAGFDLGCYEIQFPDFDVIDGPMHTNDSILVCGNPSFGRAGTADRVEYRTWFKPSDCTRSSAPNVRSSRLNTGAALENLPLPTSNAALADTALPQYRFRGATDIVLQDSTLSVNGQSMPFPPNGVVSVEEDTSRACPPHDPDDPYRTRGGCAIATVKGRYARSLSITASQDIVIAGDVTQTSGANALLGLVATDFVRVEHRVAPHQTCSPSVPNAGPTGDRRVEAAVISLRQTFEVDNVFCGPTVGKLILTGAIVQNWRGLVSGYWKGPGGGEMGYKSDYRYDDRFAYRSPPYIVQPSQAAWNTVRIVEQTGDGTSLR